MYVLDTNIISELEKGVLALERRTPPQGRALRAWLTGVRSAFEGRILPFDETAAVRCAAMHTPNPKPDRNAMIAATAIQHGMPLAARNLADFSGTGAQVMNPFDFV